MLWVDHKWKTLALALILCLCLRSHETRVGGGWGGPTRSSPSLPGWPVGAQGTGGIQGLSELICKMGLLKSSSRLPVCVEGSTGPVLGAQCS